MRATGFNRQAGKLVLLALAVGCVLGFALDSVGMLPVPAIEIDWTVPAMRASEYVPAASSNAGEEVVLIYVGSSTCAWSNVQELPLQVRRLKTIMQQRARTEGRQFATIGIARDRLASVGLSHLKKFGPFDEVMAGRSGANRGIQEYIYGAGSMAGPDATPQIILVSRRLAFPANHVSIVDERVILRKRGFAAISEWIAEGAPVSTDDG